MQSSSILLCLALAAASAPAATIDRVAVVIGNNVFTETELLEELRITQFLNGEPLDLSPAARRAAADRLVDQQLIRSDMEMSRYPQPAPAEVDDMFRKFRESRFRNDAEYREALSRYGVTEEQLKERLKWQLAAVRFTDARFKPLTLPQGTPAQGEASRSMPGTTVDDQMSAWLKDMRSRTRIQFRKEAFE